jgi:exopolysaccharide production protein ExoZ
LTIESVKDSVPLEKRDATKLNSIQALRGVAILFVLATHIGLCEIAYGGSYLPSRVAFGNMGVDLFFCISGFIMVTITSGKDRHNWDQIKDFFLKRLIRIYPLYWVIAILSIAIWYSIPTPAYVYIPHTDLLGYYTKSFFLLPNVPFPVVLQSWSLTYEIYFYLVFGFFLSFSRKHLPKLLLVWSCFVIAGKGFLLLDSANYQNAFSRLLTDQMTLEFILGCFIALTIKNKLFEIPSPKLLLIAGIAGIGITIAANPFGSHFLRFAWFGIPSILILYACVLGEARKGWIFPQWLVSMGDISYSMYLSHLATLTLVSFFWSRLVIRKNLGLSLLLSAILAVVAISVAFLSYNFIEQPLLGFCRKLFLKPSQKKRV